MAVGRVEGGVLRVLDLGFGRMEWGGFGGGEGDERVGVRRWGYGG